MKFQLCLPTLAVLLASTLGPSVAKPIATAEIKAKSAMGFNLLTFAEGAEPVWKSTAETDALISEGVRFVSFFLPHNPCFSDCSLRDRLT